MLGLPSGTDGCFCVFSCANDLIGEGGNDSFKTLRTANTRGTRVVKGMPSLAARMSSKGFSSVS